MRLTEEELEASAIHQRNVATKIIGALSEGTITPGLETNATAAFTATVDGILLALATIVEGSEMLTTPRAKRQFAEECGKGLTKMMREVRARLDATEH